MTSQRQTLSLLCLFYLGFVSSLAPVQRCNYPQRRSDLSHVETSSQICNLHNVEYPSRRSWIAQGMKAILGSVLLVESCTVGRVNADEEEDFFDDPEIKELYDNPAMPQAPEERSGLTVLRVAEVAQFQEKILRSIASGELEGVKVAPMQFQFGTQILLRNSNLDGNMKLMINQEIPRKRRKDAVQCAVAAMNTLQGIATFSGSIQRDFETIEMVELADMYRDVRVNLNQLYEFLPEQEKDKYYGYFVAVTEYEKKIAQGTYNPDIDGILKFDK
jgi:hypothetical protein